MRLLVALLVAATVSTSGCTRFCSSFCGVPVKPEGVPDAGIYGVCSVTPGEHTLEKGDLVEVGKFDKTTEVKLDAGTDDEVTVKMFPAARGLIGQARFRHQAGMLAHLVRVAKSVDPLEEVDCTTTDPEDVIRLDFMWKDARGRWIATTADTDGPHAHGEVLK